MDLQCYDIAHYLGHTALNHLYKAYRIYIMPVSTAVAENGLGNLLLDLKQQAEAEPNVAMLTVRDLNLSRIAPRSALYFSTYLELLRRREVEHCIDAAIYFQAMLEANINNVLGPSKAKGSFKNKWIKFLTAHRANIYELEYFKNYYDNIYLKIRVPSIRMTDRACLTNLEKIRFSFFHENLKLLHAG